MIPQNLIEKIHRGKAKFQTWATGGTGSTRIPVPKNNYIVIVGFHWSHFSEYDPLSADDRITQMFNHCLHNLIFRSYGNEFLYALRSTFLYQGEAGAETFHPIQNTETFETYQVHKTDCHIDIWRINEPSIWSISVSKLSDKTTELAGPIGYGTLNNTPNQNCLREILFDGVGSQYVPYGENQGLPLQAEWREQFRSNITNLTALFPPATTSQDGANTFPILNISYVLVNEPFEMMNR